MTTTANKHKTINEYRARFTDPNTRNVHTIAAETLDALQKDIRHTLGNAVQFEVGDQNNSQIIVMGSQPLGWISQYEVPEVMSVKSLNSYTLSKAA